MAPADGEIIHGHQLQQDRVVKVWNSHPVIKSQEKSHQMQISHVVRSVGFASCCKITGPESSTANSHMVAIGQMVASGG